MGNKRNLEDALNEVLNNIDSIVDEVVQEAGVKARKDYKNKAEEVVKHYYNSYKPTARNYQRQYRLYKSYHSFNKTSGKDIYVGVNFNDKKLNNAYSDGRGSHSNYHQEGDEWKQINWSTQQPGKIYNADGTVQYEQFGAVEWSFILGNFWEGEHPVTKGNKKKGYTYKPKKDEKSPEDLFAEYVKTYPEEVMRPFIENRIRHKVFKQLLG